MTPFKEQLNKELGESSCFTKELQATILQNAQQSLKKKIHWQYPIVLTSMLAIILFFIMIGPWVTVNHSQQTLNEIAQVQSVSQFSMMGNWEEDSFKAGRVGWVLGQKDFQQGEETKLLGQVLQHAQLSEEDARYSSFRDVWIQFEDGQVAKLKMRNHNDQLAFTDIDAGLFYKIDDEVAEESIAFFRLFEQDDLLPNGFFIVLLGLFLLRWIVEIVVRKVFSIPKKTKYMSKGHQLATIIGSFVYFCVMISFILKGWLFYYVVVIGILLCVSVSKIVIDYHYGREEKRHYVTIADTIIMWISLIIFVLLVKM